jgi:hypothetical protein
MPGYLLHERSASGDDRMISHATFHAPGQLNSSDTEISFELPPASSHPNVTMAMVYPTSSHPNCVRMRTDIITSSHPYPAPTDAD